ncbi:MAG: putative sugar O-methyltransferase [Actinobacteria bacterium]|nr:putative sugar O-methyltransferase [Actinomycetota bacterium]
MTSPPPALGRAKAALGRSAERLDLSPPSAMLTSERARVRRLGNFAFAMRGVTGIRRTRWLLNVRQVPRPPIERRAPQPVDAVDLAIAERLIAAHRTPSAPAAGENMWAWISENRQRELAERLAGDDPRALAQLLVAMFREDFVLGMAQGPLVWRANSRLEDQAWALKSVDSLVSLAEAAGVVPVENPEQGGSGLAFRGGLEGLLTALEEALGFRLDFPDVGAQSGLLVDGRLITPSTPDQVYAALRLDDAIRINLDTDSAAHPRVTEIGGGYGALCYWFLQRRPGVASYTIVDLPLVNAIQGYFLARALGPENVSFHGEAPSLVRILPDHALAEAAAPCDAVVNKDSMPEMPPEAMVEYLEWAKKNCRGVFYSYNQEAAGEFLGEAQGVVPAAVAELGGFERVRRETAWVRVGYVEEVYRCMAAAEARGERPHASQASPRRTSGPPSA